MSRNENTSIHYIKTFFEIPDDLGVPLEAPYLNMIYFILRYIPIQRVSLEAQWLMYLTEISELASSNSSLAITVGCLGFMAYQPL